MKHKFLIGETRWRENESSHFAIVARVNSKPSYFDRKTTQV
jgi:hypothetical protein